VSKQKFSLLRGGRHISLAQRLGARLRALWAFTVRQFRAALDIVVRLFLESFAFQERQ
jgi:hypothetical protein